MGQWQIATLGAASILILYNWLKSDPTARNIHGPSLSRLGQTRKEKIRGTAVICGGSISGILAARVCADNFENVVLVDPEFSKVREGQKRTRIVQYNALHGYLMLAIYGLEKLWPNIFERIIDEKGLRCSTDANFYFEGTPAPAPHKTYSPEPLPQGISIRRSKLDTILESLLMEGSSNVRIVEGIVRQVVPGGDKATLQSVIIRDSQGNTITLEDTSLVIDCTGSSRAGMKWLASEGYPLPQDLVVSYNPHLIYVTVEFIVPLEVLQTLPIPGGYDSCGWICGIGLPKEYKTGFLLNRSDSNIIQWCCAAWGEDTVLPKTPDDIDPYLDAVSECTPSWVIETIRRLRDEGTMKFDLITGKMPCSRVQYNSLPSGSLPLNFISMGDALQKLNPVNGQGITQSMLCAMTLNDMLAKSSTVLPRGFSSKYFATIFSQLDELWAMSKINDYGYDTTEPISGESLDQGRFARWYTKQALELCSKSETMAATLYHIRQMLRPASDMMRPKIIFLVILNALGLI